MYVVFVNGKPQEFYDGLLTNSSMPTVFSSLEDAKHVAESTLALGQMTYKSCNWGIVKYGYTIHRITTEIVVNEEK